MIKKYQKGKIILRELEPITRWLGLPKAEVNNLNIAQLNALKDLQSYINNGSKYNTFVFNPSIGYTWKIHPESGDIPGVKAFSDSKYSKIWSRGGRTLTDDGICKYITNEESVPVNGGFSGIFPRPEGFGWSPGELLSSPHSRHSSSIIMTSPRVDATAGSMGEIPDDLIAKLPNFIDPNMVKNFWINTNRITRPGTYISGDEGSMPLGFSILNAYDKGPGKNGYAKIANLLFDDSNKILVSRRGLTPDSYSSIIRQAQRPGMELRYGQPFNEWTDTAVKNRHIYDSYVQYLNKKIAADDYLKIVNEWIDSIGGTEKAFKDFEGKVWIPHPFIYRKKQGGILKRK